MSTGAEPASAPAELLEPHAPAFGWLPVMALVTLPLVLVREGLRPITDPDAAWHVLLGRALLGGVNLATDVDPLSSATTVPWVFHQWLPEVAAAIADERVGWWGVGWLAHAGRLLVVLALWWVCRREAERLAAVVALGIGLAGVSMSLGPRPQLVGLALLAITVGAWRATARDGRPRWWLVPLTWLWACSHGSWSLGVGFGCVQVAAIAIDRRRARPAEGLGPILRLAAVPAASGLAALVTPVGPRLVTAQGHIAAVSDLVTEWQRPDLGQTATVVTALAALVVALRMITGRRAQDLPATDLVSLGVAVAALLAYQRTVAVSAIVLAPAVAAALGRLLRRPRPAADGVDRWLLPAASIASLGIMALLLPGAAARPGGVPDNLSPALSALPAGTVIFNDETLGGWLLMAHPQVTPTIDTRFEAYGRPALLTHLDLVGAPPDASNNLRAAGCSAVLLGSATPLVRALASDPRWMTVGEDDGFTLLVRR